MSPTIGEALLPGDELGRIFVDPYAYADLGAWHAAASRLRRDDPVHRIEAAGFEPFFAVTRHADIVEIERQHDKFWNTTSSVLGPIEARERLRSSGADIKTLIHMDGAEHRAHRKITNDRFKPANNPRKASVRERLTYIKYERGGSEALLWISAVNPTDASR